MDEERVVETERAYADGEVVRIRVRRRGHFVHLDDDGAAVGKARALGATPDWLELANEVVAVEGFNVNRRGVVFVRVGRGRDIDALADRLGDTAHTVHTTLLETIAS